MPDPDIEIIRVDFDDADAVRQYLDMLDAYALDPMGAGQHLSAEVRADNPGARGLYESSGFVPAPCSLFMEKAL